MTTKLITHLVPLIIGSLVVLVGQSSSSSERPFLSDAVINSRNDSEASSRNAMTLRKDIWVIPLIIISSINIMMLIFFEVYVAIKTFETVPNRRHLFLGQTLLFGLFLSSAMGFIFSLEPHRVTCAIIRFGLGLSYAIVFVTLLVKLVFLISLNSGVYLPANYQSLLICFGIGIQLAIGIQWLVQQPPQLSTNRMCQTRFEVLLLALIYDMLLLMTVTVLSIKCRTIRDNHKEATYIGQFLTHFISQL